MSFKTYTLILALFVFVMLTAVFSGMIVFMIKQQIKLIRAGVIDAEIKQAQLEKASKGDTACKYCSAVLCCIITAAFLFAVVTGFMGDSHVKKIPGLKVVASPSMSSKYEKNTYLFENGLDNQLDTFDLIVLRELPPENELKLYDIVVYEMEDYLVIHRIVGIEEPNEKHPNERYFLMQGDAAQYPDRFPVKYEQMRSIYRDERVPFVGSFVYFMQSPAGILCYLLILFTFIAIPYAEKKLEQEYALRLQAMEDSEKAVAYAEV